MPTKVRYWLLLSSLVLASGCRHHPSAIESSATYLDNDDARLDRHTIAWPPPLRLSQEEWDQLQSKSPTTSCAAGDYLPYLVRISEKGFVEKATLQPYNVWCGEQQSALDPPPFVRKHLAEADLSLRKGRFRPWILNGNPTPVTVQVDLELAPPEKYGSFVPLPSPVDLSTVAITMERRGCEGECPAYTVTIHGDGTVEYQGFEYVAVKGKKTSFIGPKVVAELVSQFDKALFFSALPHYLGAYDSGNVTLRLDVNHVSHAINDSTGFPAGLPTSVAELESSIDEVGHTWQWVYGTN